MSQKTTLEGTYRWIPVAQELPDDSETVLVCNLEDWDDPVDTGYYCAQEWHRGYFPDCPLDGKGYTEDGDPYPDPSWNPPTHWMRLPEPPGLASFKLPTGPNSASSMTPTPQKDWRRC